MGSGTTRKKNDTVIINRPKPKKGSGSSGGSSGGQGQHENMNAVCPPTLKVKLAPQKPIPVGAHLHIEKEDIIYSGQKVGSLTKAQSATVSRCITEGFRYPGEVVNERDTQYGVFTRK